MKKIYILLLAMFALLPARAENDVILNIELDLFTVNIPFSDSPTMTFDRNEVIVTTKDNERGEAYLFDAFVKMYYTKTTPTSLESSLKKAGMSLTEGRLAVSGLKAGQSVTVCNAAGQMLLTSKADADGIAVISTEGMSNGILVVKAGNQSFKINKK